MSTTRRIPRLVRQLARLPGGRWLGQRAYFAVARVAAESLARLRPVESVLLGGSLARGQAFPGLSDIDLTAVVTLPDAPSERDLLRLVRRRLVWLNLAGPLVQNLDLIEKCDVPLLHAFGDSAFRNFHTSFQLVCGVLPQLSSSECPPEERSLNHLRACCRRWAKGVGFLLPRLRTSPPFVVRHYGQRLLLDLLTGWLDLDRYVEPHEAARRARARLARDEPDVAALLEHAMHGPEQPLGPWLDVQLGAALGVLDLFARERTRAWQGSWEVEGREAEKTGSLRLRAACDGLLGRGLQAVVAAPRGATRRQHDLLAVVAPDVPLEVAMAGLRQAMSAAMSETGWSNAGLSGIVPLTRSLWAAAALYEPAPYVGAVLTARQAVWVGELPPPPVRPDPHDFASLIRNQVARRLVRLRTRGLRPLKQHHASAAGLADERAMMRLLEHARDTQQVRLFGVPPPPGIDWVEESRAWCAEQRRWLAPMAAQRQHGLRVRVEARPRIHRR